MHPICNKTINAMKAKNHEIFCQKYTYVGLCSMTDEQSKLYNGCSLVQRSSLKISVIFTFSQCRFLERDGHFELLSSFAH